MRVGAGQAAGFSAAGAEPRGEYDAVEDQRSDGENSLRITELGLEMKAEIEKAREQVQNLE